MIAYDRRPAPAPAFTPDQKAWVDVETAHIQQALAGLGATPTPNPTVVVAAADVSNIVSTTNQGSGLLAQVVAGTAYTFRWWIWLAGTATGGVVLVITHPTYTSALTHQKGTTTGTTTFGESVLTTTTVPLTLSTFKSFSGTGWVQVEHTIVPSASGAVELAFKPVSTGEAQTVKAGSFLEVFTP